MRTTEEAIDSHDRNLKCKYAFSDCCRKRLWVLGLKYMYCRKPAEERCRYLSLFSSIKIPVLSPNRFFIGFIKISTCSSSNGSSNLII